MAEPVEYGFKGIPLKEYGKLKEAAEFNLKIPVSWTIKKLGLFSKSATT